MRLLLNLIWLVLAGFWMCLGYLLAAALWCITVIGIPFGVASYRIGMYALWPFGREVVKKPGAGVGSGTRDLYVGDGRAGADAIAGLGRDGREALAEANDDTADAAIAHEQIGAEADDGDGQIARNAGEEVGEVGLISGREQRLRRAADAEPGDVGELGAGRQPSAQPRQLGLEVSAQVRQRHLVSLTIPKFARVRCWCPERTSES